MLFVKVYLMIALPVIAAIFMVYVHFYTQKRIRKLKAKQNYKQKKALDTHIRNKPPTSQL